MSEGTHVAAVVENVVEQATEDAERRARDAEQAAKAIAESAILQEQERRFNSFIGEQETWRNSVAEAYSQRLAEETAPIREALTRLTEQLSSRAAEPPPAVIVAPPEQSTQVPSAEPAMIAESAVVDGPREGQEAGPAPTPPRRGIRLL
jgi:hypothetical protein